MLEEGFEHEDGTIRAPDEPGLGIQLDEDVLAEASDGD
jgi:L-alanine-DL-glutamate epimerase-like enolase superfamily enzyme